MSSVLAHPDALISATTAPATASAGKSEAIFKASGLYPTPGAIDSFPARMLEQMQTEAALETLGHSDLRGRLYRPADSWQVGHQAVSLPFNRHSALQLCCQPIVSRGSTYGTCFRRAKIEG